MTTLNNQEFIKIDETLDSLSARTDKVLGNVKKAETVSSSVANINTQVFLSFINYTLEEVLAILTALLEVKDSLVQFNTTDKVFVQSRIIITLGMAVKIKRAKHTLSLIVKDIAGMEL